MSVMETWVESGSAVCTLWRNLAEWSQETFGSDAERGPIAPLKHLACEVQEAIETPGDVEEYADCLLLVFDSSRRAGISLETLLGAADAKLELNKRRTWGKPTSAEEPVFHTKGGQQ